MYACGAVRYLCVSVLACVDVFAAVVVGVKVALRVCCVVVVGARWAL